MENNIISYYPFDLESKDRRKHPRHLFHSYCKIELKNKDIFSFAKSHDISLVGMKVECEIEMARIPIYVNVHIAVFDEDMQLSGYIDTLPTLHLGKFIYTIKFLELQAEQREKIEKLLEALERFKDRRDLNTRNSEAGEQAEHKKIQHKYKVSKFADRRQGHRRLIAEQIEIDNRQNIERRGKDRRKIEEKILRTEWLIADKLKSQAEKLFQFYKKTNFIYRDKLQFLLPLKDEVIDTVSKLLHCRTNLCKYLFLTDGNEMNATAMSVQYAEDSWMMQHFAISDNANTAIKELILSMLNWTIKNKEMNYLLSYFQNKTIWAYKTYHGVLNNFKHVSIREHDYIYKKIEEIDSSSILSQLIEIIELTDKNYSEIYSNLVGQQDEIFINALGFKKNSYNLERVSKNFEKIGLYRKREYFVAQKDNKIVGFAFVDVSSEGINLSLLFNTFYIFVFDTADKENIYMSLISSINTALKKYGKTYSIGLTNPEDLDVFKKIGYTFLRKYSHVAYSRDDDQFEGVYKFMGGGRHK